MTTSEKLKVEKGKFQCQLTFTYFMLIYCEIVKKQAATI